MKTECVLGMLPSKQQAFSMFIQACRDTESHLAFWVWVVLSVKCPYTICWVLLCWQGVSILICLMMRKQAQKWSSSLETAAGQESFQSQGLAFICTWPQAPYQPAPWFYELQRTVFSVIFGCQQVAPQTLLLQQQNTHNFDECSCGSLPVSK